jgi:nicotinate-nucleotide adenylyltransferase
MHIVFGGSFNPPTIAHQHMISKLHETFNQSRVLILPVGDDYTKPELISIKHRINMLKLMTEDMKNVYISDLEVNRPWLGTLRSLDELSKDFSELSFVIGSDNLKGLFAWIHYETLLAKYPFIVMTRPGSLSKEEAEAMFQHLKHQFTFIDFDEDISSTKVRQDIQNAAPYLLPKVYAYIMDHKLYKENSHV